ncbi:flagellar hook-basal body complex protein FliE [Candidatus Nitrotoga sp. M5]|uniref:flagellar hook-basal body complex protein FliE n=1 Tax=Candidatus Nitrotoga sp. M5 TaxID=2890409 RepID=UPI001EF668C9|nr:flagellar hook-basal body complex protein FliE [Candidatus Nitrotoga sp. M5]CAH1387768.1 Flagellar hook-basal body complex protein FliE [Candidatus Nitrotoga sp. M5]
MKVSGVDSLLSEMRAAMALAQGGAAPKPAAKTTTDFASVLKTSLDSVAQAQSHAGAMQKAFVRGDENVTLSNVMIDGQKANIAFQATLQVRNKVIAAYNDIMNMQV